MAKIERFEEIRGWQEARKLVTDIYLLTSTGAFSRDYYGLRDQSQRAAVSVMTNVAEGFDRESKAEFARFLGIARCSAVEVQSLLHASLDIGYIDKAKFDEYYGQAQRAKALFGALKHLLLKPT